jgi:hypothetical protein
MKFDVSILKAQTISINNLIKFFPIYFKRDANFHCGRCGILLKKINTTEANPTSPNSIKPSTFQLKFKYNFS